MDTYTLTIEEIEEIYNSGYIDGEHDGYYSTLIKNNVEEKHYGKSLLEKYKKGKEE